MVSSVTHRKLAKLGDLHTHSRGMECSSGTELMLSRHKDSISSTIMIIKGKMGD